VVIWRIFPVLVGCAEKNLATLLWTTPSCFTVCLVVTQGDQIGRIFLPMCDCLLCVAFIKIAENYCGLQKFGLLISLWYTLLINYGKNGLGYILGDFAQTHLVTLLLRRSDDHPEPGSTSLRAIGLIEPLLRKTIKADGQGLILKA
jgi:hypothetical protein